MRLAIVGSQEKHWPGDTYDEVLEVLIRELELVQPDEVVSGGADGVDSWAQQLAEQNMIPVRVEHPRGAAWEFYVERNRIIAETCDLMLCIRSKVATTYGSGWTADYAESLGVPVKRVII